MWVDQYTSPLRNLQSITGIWMMKKHKYSRSSLRFHIDVGTRPDLNRDIFDILLQNYQESQDNLLWPWITLNWMYVCSSYHSDVIATTAGPYVQHILLQICDKLKTWSYQLSWVELWSYRRHLIEAKRPSSIKISKDLSRCGTKFFVTVWIFFADLVWSMPKSWYDSCPISS